MISPSFPLKSILIAGLALSVLLVAIAPGVAQGPPVQPPTPAATAAIIPGEIVVKFQTNVGRVGAQNSLRAEGLSPLELSPTNNTMRVAVEPGQEARAIAELQARGDVEFAAFNYYVEALGDPNDPYYYLQWALKQAQDHDIDAPEAWDIHTGGSNVTIAVVDSGVDLDHPDLAARIVTGYDFANKDNNPDDDNGHGTHVAGIAAAVGNNGLGIAGVSWGARIMPVKVLNSAGSGYLTDVADGITYAVNQGADIINLSLGIKFSKWPCDTPYLEEAINYAVSQNVLVVAAAGNDGQNGVNCPAAYGQVIAVGSTDNTDLRSSFSNYGSDLDIAAPGRSIYSTVPPSIFGNYYYTMSGTSMSTPYVAGLAALLRSFAPSLTNSQVRNIIQETADDLAPPSLPTTDQCANAYPAYAGVNGWDPCFGYGRINARRALERIALQTVPAQPLLFIDDTMELTSSQVQITTGSPEIIAWSAVISPTETWLELSPPTAGSVSASSTNQFIILSATNPSLGNYGLYTATLVLTGTFGSGGTVGPVTTQVQLYYVPKVNIYYFPLFYKN